MSVSLEKKSCDGSRMMLAHCDWAGPRVDWMCGGTGEESEGGKRVFQSSSHAGTFGITTDELQGSIRETI